MRNPSRPSPCFSYCKQQKLWWRLGNEARCTTLCGFFALYLDSVSHMHDNRTMRNLPLYLNFRGEAETMLMFQHVLKSMCLSLATCIIGCQLFLCLDIAKVSSLDLLLKITCRYVMQYNIISQ